MFKSWFRSVSNDQNRTMVTQNPPPSTHESGVILLRHPVLDRQQKIIGYDVGIRSIAATPGVDDALHVLDEQIFQQLMQLGLPQTNSNQLWFIRVNANVLADEQLEFPHKDHLVLVLDRWHEITISTLLAQCAKRVAQGWQLAADNFPESTDAEQLLPYLTWLRFDLRRYSAVDLEQQLRQLRSHSELRVLARQVETEDELEACQALSFDAFQGYFFTRVKTSQARRIDHDRIRIMRLLNLLAQNAELKELESVLRRDPMLVYKVLMYINSPLSGLDQPITSIEHALMFLGYGPLYRWLTVLLFTSGTRYARDQAILQQALVRARLMELLAMQSDMQRDAAALFLTGMLSLLDALLNTELASALEGLTLAEPLQQALFAGTGPYAPYLKLVIALERVQMEDVDVLLHAMNITGETLNQLHVQAMEWAVMLDMLPDD